MAENIHDDDWRPLLGGLTLVNSYTLEALKSWYEQCQGDTLGVGQLASLAAVHAEEQANLDYLAAAEYGTDAEAEALRAVRDWVGKHGGPDHAEDL